MIRRNLNAFLIGLPLVVLVAPVVILATPLVAEAASTGEIRGKVVDATGKPVAGVEVVLSGDSLAGEIETVTTPDGGYNFLSVPPGVHNLLFVADGFNPVRAEVEVRLEQTTYVPIGLSVATDVVEEIVVEEKLPVVDTSRSSFSAELGDEMLQNLPVGRSYQDAVNMLPGVSGRIDTSQGGPGDGNPSVRGEGQYGNNYMVDGVSTRDPATKTFGSNVNFDAIEDIQVYTDGAPAEFGQFAGMIVNVVTKDGGDEHHGSIGYWLDTDASSGKYNTIDYESHTNTPHSKRDFLSHSLSATLGGPIVKEKLWYFGAVNVGNDTSVYEGMNPETPYSSNSAGGFAKLSWFATPDVTIRYVFNADGARTNNEQTSSQFTSETQSQRRQLSTSHLLTIGWRPDALTELELKGGFWNTNLNAVPQSGDEDTPNIVDLDTGIYSGNWTDFDYNKRNRLGGGVTFTRIVQQFLGDHKFKAGSEFWVVRDERQLIYTGPGEGTSYNAGTNADGTRFDCAAADFSDCLNKTEYVDVGPLGHRGLMFSFFLQDDWTIGDRVTLNLGARFDREQLFQNEGSAVVMDNPDTPDTVEEIPYRMNMPAPRLGLAWDITGDNKTLLSFFGGQYYDVAGNSFADWGDSKSAASFYELCNASDPYCEGEDQGDGWLLYHSQDNSANPLIYSSKLKPARMDKVTVGIEREIFPLFAVGLRGILSQTVNIPEDVNTDDYSWYIQPSKNKSRDYKAIELTAEKKFDDRWQLLAAWTISAARGNTPGQFESASGGSIGSDGNNVGVYLDSPTDKDVRAGLFDGGYGWYLDGLSGLGTENDDEGWYGYLPYHSFHAVKINGSYTFPIGTTIGLVYEFDSGHAWQKRSYVDLYGDYYGFSEGRGSRMMPPVNYIDVRVAHKFEIDDLRDLELTLDIFNLPDLEGAVSYYENDDANFGLTLYRQAPRSARVGLRMTY